ncbi:MAG: hypothetical protein IPM69_03645 [Ignavibacteria bacterium]|nr:hypothetical protein [Ignavibacteria bacterium]
MKKILLLILFITVTSQADCFGQSAEEHFKRGTKKLELGDYKGAIKHFSKAIQKKSTYAEAYDSRAYVKGILEDYAGAVVDLSKVIELSPNDSEGYVKRGIVKTCSMMNMELLKIFRKQ